LRAAGRAVVAGAPRLHDIETSQLPGITRALWLVDKEQLQLIANQIAALRDLDYVEIRSDVDGIFIKSGTPVDERRRIQRTMPIRHTFEGSDAVLGATTIAASLERVYDTLWDKLLITLLTNGVKTFAVSIFILFSVHHLVTRHLQTMAQHVRSLRPGEALHPLRLEKSPRTRNELDQVADAINAMEADLLEAYEELETRLAAEQASRLELERLGRLKDEFLYTLSHELRTPLTAIIGWVDLLQAGAVAPNEKASAFEVISRNAHTLRRLIDDLLDISRLISGQTALEKSDVNLETLIASSLKAVQSAAAGKQLSLSSDCSTANPVIRGDARRLRQALSNLVTNAVKFTPPGGTVHVSLTDDGPSVRIDVRDTGIGIAQDFLPHIFERFRQEDSARTRTYGGLGLGLSIVKELVDLHGGKISVESRKHEGSCFSIWLPRDGAAVSARAAR
jgi:signal transduction histidine kinase